MTRLLRSCIFFGLFVIFAAPAGFSQSISASSLTAVPPPQKLVPIPIFSISRTSNVVTISTVDPLNPDQYAQQSNQIGKNITITGVTVDPSSTINGTFPICGPPTPGCVTPTTYGFSVQSAGADFSVASNASTDVSFGYTFVARTPCPLIPTGYFSFCGDPLPGGGLANPNDTSLLEVISTEDEAGTMVWASSLGDGNTGSNRVTGCEQQFIESGNEYHFVCLWERRLGGYFDIDMRNQWMFFDVGDGLTSDGVGGEFLMSGIRKLAGFGIVGRRSVIIDMGATPPGTIMPTTGVLRFQNGSTLCWENSGATAPMCQSTDANDHFTFDNGVSTATYNTAVICASTSAQCGSAAAGSFTVPPGVLFVSVNTTAVTPQSQIFLQEDSSLSGALGTSCNTVPGHSYLITSRSPEIGFTVEVGPAPITAGAPACLNYHIMN